MNKDIEEKLLANSKGAPYMSFILDVEIVVKSEDGKQGHLAENKLKADKVPYQKSKFSEDVRQSSARNKNDTKVYSMLPETRNVFKQKRAENTDINPYLKSETLEKLDDISEIDNTTKYEMSVKKGENQKIEQNSDGIPVVLTPSEKRVEKKKKRKEERKARVFKGKVEKIDFLEVNRIFMCNYFKNQMRSFPGKRLRPCGQSFSSTLITKNTTENVISSPSDSNNVYFHNKNLSTNLKKYKFWKRSSTKLNVHSAPINQVDNIFSCGDSKNCNNGQNVHNNDDGQISLRAIYIDKPATFKPPVIAVETVNINNISMTQQDKNKIHSKHNFFQSSMNNSNKVRKSESWPVIHYNLLKKPFILCPNHNYNEDYIVCNVCCNQVCDKNYFFKQTLAPELNVKVIRELPSLDILFNNKENCMNPKITVEHGISESMHIKNCEYNIKQNISGDLTIHEPTCEHKNKDKIYSTIIQPNLKFEDLNTENIKTINKTGDRNLSTLCLDIRT